MKILNSVSLSIRITERTAYELEELTRILCKNRTSIIKELIENRAKEEGIKYVSKG